MKTFTTYNLRTMNVVRIVQWFVSIPNHSKRGCDVRLVGDVREKQWLAVDGVRQELSVHLSHSAFDVELTDEPN